MEGLLGKKVGMTQIFTDDGTAVPVTVILAVAISDSWFPSLTPKTRIFFSPKSE